jgi:hypothetical protein
MQKTTKIEKPAPTAADHVVRPDEATTKTTGPNIRDAAQIDVPNLRRRADAEAK